MTRYIDADALLEKVQFRLPIVNQTAEVIAGCVDITRRLIKNAPTIEARPVVRGEWELHGDDDDLSASYFCSVCGYNMDEDEYLDSFSSYKFCPNCGADMRRKEDANA